ncbi:MAG: response regulator [Bacteroidota bacterium]|jgi:two-component system, sensor histidine kinase and response regulator
METNLKKSRILIVDDQIANIEMLEGCLEMEGYTKVSSTTDSRKVIPLLDSFKPDLILLDLMMPLLSGYEVMEQLRVKVAKDDFLPVLVLTADITQEAKQKALTLGATDFLTKPFDLTEVGLRINNLLFARSLMHQLKDQNLILDEKVKQRTAQLEQSNIDLTVARDKAQASDRLKTAFMQNISHEVRTPLNGILGFSKLMAEPDLSAADRRNFLSFLETSTNRLIQTITDYMDISLIATGSLEIARKPVAINDIMRETKNLYSKAFESKSLALDFAIHNSLNEIYIKTDPELLRKIISHLLSNALKFTSAGTVTVDYSITKDNFIFSVEDTGQGISEEARERIFDPFMQEDIATTRGHEGSGLGLSIVSGCIRLLGGELKLKSRKHIGSVFTVILPVGEVKKNDETNLVTSPDTKVKSPVLLVAEDDDANRLFLEVVLKKIGPTVLVATNGKEAVELCRAHPEITLVLMDIKMPVMNGLEATQEIKTFRKDLPVIAITAYAMSGDEQKFLAAGCDDFIPKPVTVGSLENKLKEYGVS